MRGDAAISRDVLKIGVLNDQSGVYADLAGQGSVEAARLAVQDFGGEIKGRPIEILSADHQNKPELGASIAREWIEVDGVDVIVDVPTSDVALAVQKVTEDTDTAFLINGAATSSLTGEFCSPTSVHWAYDTYSLAAGTVRAMLEEGLNSWFFVTADDAFGKSLQAAAQQVIGANGGEVRGQARHALNAGDLTAHLMEAQGSEADAIGLANAGEDAVRAVRRAHELGVHRGPQRIVPLLLFLTDVKQLGLEVAQGLPLTTAFYWDRTDASRAFAERFAARRDGQRPTMVQAGVYSSLMHYLQAAAEVGDDSGQAVVDQMKRMPVDDFFATDGRVRPDGLMVHEMYRARVKRPAESEGPWDLYEIVETIPAKLAFRPLSESDCPLVDD
ncbi:ABC transporter permease [Rhodovibrio sodomensis]|uniref:ABC transporter permease n=2 Tax=Rhodovibrio sodomensis TaxID=1088 RepID=A0ABS1DDT5_9PROT|nr:ABC transporter substrate-binding protein [Rhodovibrio sodomensis]MBK1668580.1 ABC transporter permease [Rhodovibrio sodomensis]